MVRGELQTNTAGALAPGEPVPEARPGGREARRARSLLVTHAEKAPLTEPEVTPTEPESEPGIAVISPMERIPTAVGIAALPNKDRLLKLRERLSSEEVASLPPLEPIASVVEVRAPLPHKPSQEKCESSDDSQESDRRTALRFWRKSDNVVEQDLCEGGTDIVDNADPADTDAELLAKRRRAPCKVSFTQGGGEWFDGGDGNVDDMDMEMLGRRLGLKWEPPADTLKSDLAGRVPDLYNQSEAGWSSAYISEQQSPTSNVASSTSGSTSIRQIDSVNSRLIGATSCSREDTADSVDFRRTEASKKRRSTVEKRRPLAVSALRSNVSSGALPCGEETAKCLPKSLKVADSVRVMQPFKVRSGDGQIFLREGLVGSVTHRASGERGITHIKFEDVPKQVIVMCKDFPKLVILLGKSEPEVPQGEDEHSQLLASGTPSKPEPEAPQGQVEHFRLTLSKPELEVPQEEGEHTRLALSKPEPEAPEEEGEHSMLTFTKPEPEVPHEEGEHSRLLANGSPSRSEPEVLWGGAEHSWFLPSGSPSPEPEAPHGEVEHYRLSLSKPEPEAPRGQVEHFRLTLSKPEPEAPQEEDEHSRPTLSKPEPEAPQGEDEHSRLTLTMPEPEVPREEDEHSQLTLSKPELEVPQEEGEHSQLSPSKTLSQSEPEVPREEGEDSRLLASGTPSKPELGVPQTEGEHSRLSLSGTLSQSEPEVPQEEGEDSRILPSVAQVQQQSDSILRDDSLDEGSLHFWAVGENIAECTPGSLEVEDCTRVIQASGATAGDGQPLSLRGLVGKVAEDASSSSGNPGSAHIKFEAPSSTSGSGKGGSFQPLVQGFNDVPNRSLVHSLKHDTSADDCNDRQHADEVDNAGGDDYEQARAEGHSEVVEETSGSADVHAPTRQAMDLNQTPLSEAQSSTLDSGKGGNFQPLRRMSGFKNDPNRSLVHSLKHDTSADDCNDRQHADEVDNVGGDADEQARAGGHSEVVEETSGSTDVHAPTQQAVDLNQTTLSKAPSSTLDSGERGNFQPPVESFSDVPKRSLSHSPKNDSSVDDCNDRQHTDDVDNVGRDAHEHVGAGGHPKEVAEPRSSLPARSPSSCCSYSSSPFKDKWQKSSEMPVSCEHSPCKHAPSGHGVPGGSELEWTVSDGLMDIIEPTPRSPSYFETQGSFSYSFFSASSGSPYRAENVTLSRDINGCLPKMLGKGINSSSPQQSTESAGIMASTFQGGAGQQPPRALSRPHNNSTGNATPQAQASSWSSWLFSPLHYSDCRCSCAADGNDEEPILVDAFVDPEAERRA